MVDGTESPVSDGSSAVGSSADDPQTSDARYLDADPGRVARIVTALRKAHAEQATAARAASAPAPTTSPVPAPPAAGVTTGSTTDTAELPDTPAPRREPTGVRPAKAAVPTLRWNPGARYRASRLANHLAPQTPPASAPNPAQAPVPGTAAFVHAPVPAPPGHAPVPAQQGPGPVPPPPAPPAAGPVPAPPEPRALAGRLYRGPAKRTAVFEREIWHPVARSSRVPRDVSEALIAAVERYRKGSISTSGLVRAIASTHAA